MCLCVCERRRSVPVTLSKRRAAACVREQREADADAGERRGTLRHLLPLRTRVCVQHQRQTAARHTHRGQHQGETN